VPDKLAKFVQKYPGVHATTNYENVLADEEIEAVILATPAGLHYQQTRAALLAGKHILVEKPLALSLTEGRELARLASEKRLILMVGHTFLYNPAVRKIKSLYQTGALGEIYFILSQRLSLGRVRDDVNVLWNLAPHDFSILLYLVEKMPEWIIAIGARFLQHKFEDVVFVTLGFPGGMVANLQLNWLNPIKVRQMIVVGSKKMLIYDDVNPEAKITLYDRSIKIEQLETPSASATFSEFQAKVRQGDFEIPNIEFEEPLKLELEHFLHCLETGAPPLTDSRHALQVLQLLESASLSLTTGEKTYIPVVEYQ
ncbi:MAG: Gfo/Idh/MocA family oxidoreductase, partial [Candidatus Sumerlaeia bacterium]|nr:Gfo/Idh/MocA family oxidoreductase [Candidatus Sumerlaeia bacterium]